MYEQNNCFLFMLYTERAKEEEKMERRGGGGGAEKGKKMEDNNQEEEKVVRRKDELMNCLWYFLAISVESHSLMFPLKQHDQSNTS